MEIKEIESKLLVECQKLDIELLLPGTFKEGNKTTTRVGYCVAGFRYKNIEEAGAFIEGFKMGHKQASC